MTDRELMQQALDALESECDATKFGAAEDLRARLAQPEPEPEPEPVACPYCHYSHTLGAVYFDQNCAGCVKRMTAPPQREWQGLTDEEIQQIEMSASSKLSAIYLAEAQLKGKNAL